MTGGLANVKNYARLDSNQRPWDEKFQAERFRKSRRNHEINL